MDQRSQYLIQILEKIGAPLLGAVADVASRQPAAGQDQDSLAKADAQRVAELLARAIQISIDLGKSMDLANMPDQGESLRLALAALSGDIVAGQYKTLSRVPNETDLRRAVTSLEAVLTFSENFIPSKENIARLEQIKAEGGSVDAQQTVLQSVQAFVPVVNAIGAFPFGQPEKKLIQDVSERLLSHMYELTQKLFGNSLNETTRPFAELAILRALTQIYSESHSAETERLMRMSDEARSLQTMSLDAVWNAFEARVAMLEVLSLSLMTGSSAQSGGASKAPVTSAPSQPVTAPSPAQPATPPVAPPPIFKAPAPPPAAPAQLSAEGQAPVKPAIFKAPGATTPPPGAPVPSPAAAPPAAGSSPLSMFAKPGSSPPPASPPSPPEAPPAAPTPPETPPPANPSTPPSSGGPMSFFKKSDQ